MILTLEEAREHDPTIDQEDLDALETTVRTLTNNNFQNTAVRYHNVRFVDEVTIEVSVDITGLRVGDTIEVNYSPHNDGLYVIEELAGRQMKVQGAPFFAAQKTNATVTLVKYPADIKRGIKNMLRYDAKMGGKVGIKSETISRMSITYYDMGAAETMDGYPASLVSYLKKYEKMRW